MASDSKTKTSSLTKQYKQLVSPQNFAKLTPKYINEYTIFTNREIKEDGFICSPKISIRRITTNRETGEAYKPVFMEIPRDMIPFLKESFIAIENEGGDA